MASQARAMYERGSPPRSPTGFSGSIISEAASKGNCVFLLKYSPERLAKIAGLRRGITVSGAVAFQGVVDAPIKSDLMRQIKSTRDDPDRISIFEPGAIDLDRSIASSAEKKKWELYNADGQPQQQIGTIIVEEAIESETAYAQRFQAASSPSSSSSSSEPPSPVVVKVPGRAMLDFFEENLDLQAVPKEGALESEPCEFEESELSARGEGAQQEKASAEGLPVGPLSSDLVRRLTQEFFGMSFELETALLDMHLPPATASQCQEAAETVFACAVLLEGKDLTCETVEITSSESRHIRKAMNAFNAYTVARGEADESNKEFWRLTFSGRSAPFLPWMGHAHSPGTVSRAGEGDIGGEREATAEPQKLERTEPLSAEPGAQFQEVASGFSELEQPWGNLRAAEGAASATANELPPMQQPEGEAESQEGPQAEGEEVEVLPVGPQKTWLLHRLREEFENMAAELQIAPADKRFPEASVDSCNEAVDLAMACCELLDEKVLTGEEDDLNLSESRLIRDTINAYSRYIRSRAEADEAGNREYWGAKFGSRSPPFLPWIRDEHRRLPMEFFHVSEEEGGGDPVVVTNAKLTPATKVLLLLIILKWDKRDTVKTFLTGSKVEKTPKITARRPAGYYDVATAQHGLTGAIEDMYALQVSTNMNVCKSRPVHQIRFARDSVAKAPGYPAGDFYKCQTVDEKLEFAKHDTAFLHVRDITSRGGVKVGSKSGFKSMPALQLSETRKLQVGDAVRSVGVVPAVHNGIATGAVTIYRDDGRFVGRVQHEEGAAIKKHGTCDDGQSGGSWADKEEDELGTFKALAYTNNSVSSLNYIYGPEYSFDSLEKYDLSAI